jgi:predicted MPP superfamily phosphohydrolase
MHPALLTLIALFALLGHGYFWIALVNRLHAWAGPHRLIDFLTWAGFTTFATLPLVVAWQWWRDGDYFFNSQNTGPLASFAVTYCLGCAVFGLGKLIARFIRGFQDDDPHTVHSKERTFLKLDEPLPKETLRGLYPRMLGRVPGNQVFKLALDTKRLLIPRLPEKLAGLRIAHISDLHVTGRIGPEWYLNVANEVNRLQADVIVITGDLVEIEAYRDWLYESLALLRAQYGVYFILGNHDFYIDSDRTVDDLMARGLIYVGGNSLTAEWHDCPVLIAGNEAPWGSRLPELSARSNSTEAPFRLLLTHSPDQFDWACASDGDLVVAGHAHGGQVCFPILGAVAAPSLYGTRFAAGTFRRGNTVMHVTRGIAGETPLRWRCPPEIALLELASAK